MLFIFSILLAIVSIVAVTMLKMYGRVPLLELKRRARSGDETANLLYKAAAYGPNLQALLWIIIGLSGGGFLVLINHAVTSWLALILSVALLWLCFVWVPNTKSGYISNLTTRYLSTPISWLLSHVYPVLSRIVNMLGKYIHPHHHTGIYEKSDLVDLLERQKRQTDSRLSNDELRIASGALTFGDKLTGDIMTPRRELKSVKSTESIGPLLMDELHSSGHSRFPVYQDKPDNFVGILYAKDLLESHNGGEVKDVMKKKVYYVHEQQTLSEVLEAFLKTKHHLFIVVNAFEEVVGIITIEDVIEQIIGKPILDEFDKYDDLRAVAARKAKTEHQNQVPEETSPDKPKVVE